MNVIHILLGDDPIWIVFMEWEGRMDLFQLTFEPEMHLEALCWDCTDYHWAKRACCGAFPCASTVPCPAFPCPTFTLCRTAWGKITCWGEPALLRFYFILLSCARLLKPPISVQFADQLQLLTAQGWGWCPVCSMCHFQEQQLVLSMADFAPFEP